MSMPSSSTTKAAVRGTCDTDRAKIISNSSKDTTLHTYNRQFMTLKSTP